MAEVNAKDLTTKTAPASTDSMLLFGTTTNEGAKITVDNLANNILERLATKTFPNQVGGSSAATILAQLATLNSNKAGKILTTSVSITTSATGSAIILGAASHLVIATCIDKDVDTTDYLVIPYRTVAGSTWCKVFNWSLQPVANYDTNILVYYILV